jgi:hypothetical protein
VHAAGHGAAHHSTRPHHDAVRVAAAPKHKAKASHPVDHDAALLAALLTHAAANPNVLPAGAPKSAPAPVSKAAEDKRDTLQSAGSKASGASAADGKGADGKEEATTAASKVALDLKDAAQAAAGKAVAGKIANVAGLGSK